MHKDTPRRVRYALGYTALGMLNEASDELEAVDFADRLSVPVLEAMLKLHFEAEHWETVVGVGRQLAQLTPENEEAWIYWAYALRELNRIEDAKAVLHEAEPLHGKRSGILHYNLACYLCLLGDVTGARERLSRACIMDKQWKAAALDDPELEQLWASAD